MKLARLFAATMLAIMLIQVSACTDAEAPEAESPDVASCPVGSSPDEPGPAGQDRPKLSLEVAAAMDTQSGKIVALDDAGATWALDVCTNTWQSMRPSTEPTVTGMGLGMVYDAADDLVVAFNGLFVWTYSVDANVWRMLTRSAPGASQGSHFVYDPVSGDVLMLDFGRSNQLWAFSLKDNAWTEVDQGEVRPNPTTEWETYATLLAFDEEADRLVMVVRIAERATETWLFDPRAHVWTKQSATFPDMGFGWFEHGGPIAYDSAHGVSIAFSLGLMASYGVADGEWRTIEPGPGWSSGITASQGADIGDQDGPLTRLGHRLLYDPVNERIVMLGGEARMGGTDPDKMWRDLADVWAYDIADNSWLNLVPPLME